MSLPVVKWMEMLVVVVVVERSLIIILWMFDGGRVLSYAPASSPSSYQRGPIPLAGSVQVCSRLAGALRRCRKCFLRVPTGFTHGITALEAGVRRGRGWGPDGNMSHVGGGNSGNFIVMKVMICIDMSVHGRLIELGVSYHQRPYRLAEALVEISFCRASPQGAESPSD